MWFAGTTAPSGFPITVGDDNNAVCPKGFVVAGDNNLDNIYALTKSYDAMREFYLRLPSNDFKNTDLRDNGKYHYSPKLWINDTGSKAQVGTPPNAQAGLKIMASTTDYYWNSANSRWSYIDTTTVLFSPSSTWVYGNGKVNNIGIPYYRVFAIGGNWWLDTASRSLPHTITSSFAIRCMEKP